MTNNSKNTKFSLILPVYNVAPYLHQCLNSIANQSFQDFEVICINDGSTDDSLEILNSFAKKDCRFKIFSQENLGQGIARNKGLKLSNGQYIVFIDPDDWIEINALDEIFKYFKETNAEVIEFNYRVHNEYSGNVINYNNGNLMLKNFDYDLNSICRYNWKNIKNGCLSKLDMHVWTRAYASDFVKHAEAVFAPNKHGEDHLFANAIVLNAKNIYYLNKYLYNYRCRKGSSANITTDDNFSIFENCQLMKDYLIKHSFFDELKEEFQQYKVQALAWHYNNIPRKNLKKYQKMCKEILSPEEYKQLLNKSGDDNSFGEFFFSLKNKSEHGMKVKIITILGFKIKLRTKKINY